MSISKAERLSVECRQQLGGRTLRMSMREHGTNVLTSIQEWVLARKLSQVVLSGSRQRVGVTDEYDVLSQHIFHKDPLRLAI